MCVLTEHGLDARLGCKFKATDKSGETYDYVLVGIVFFNKITYFLLFNEELKKEEGVVEDWFNSHTIMAA